MIIFFIHALQNGRVPEMMSSIILLAEGRENNGVF